MAAHQAPPFLGFSRQEHWSGLPFPSPMHESESEVSQSCPALCDPMEGSLLGYSQAPLSMGFFRYWSGLPFLSPMHESESEVAQSCPTLSNPMVCSPPGSSVHGIFWATVLEWGAIAFSK